MKEVFPGIYKEKGLMTKNLVPGFASCEETLIKKKGKEYRTWDPNRSKLAAAISKGLKKEPLKPGMKVLYLGVASGTTASYISDIVGKKGLIYGVEFSDRVLADLFPVASRRKNIVSILEDARKPKDYTWIESVDLVFQDVAQPDMIKIFVKNAELFLKSGGFAMLAVKSRSVDVTKNPKEVYKQSIKRLKKSFHILNWVKLDPFEKDHCFIVARKR